jgi:hypothetical protein
VSKIDALVIDISSRTVSLMRSYSIKQRNADVVRIASDEAKQFLEKDVHQDRDTQKVAFKADKD